jgi:hypothetical protein
MNERMQTGHNLEVDRVPLLGSIYESWDWQRGAERRGISNAAPRTGKRAPCECSTADRKIPSRQNHRLSAFGCTILLGDGPSVAALNPWWPEALPSLEQLAK